MGNDGIITTVAGNGGHSGYGDGGAATNASLDQPSGVAVDASGNLFIADTGNNRIRKVGVNGLITTNIVRLISEVRARGLSFLLERETAQTIN